MHEENSKKRFSKIPGIIRGCPPGGCIFIKKQVYIDFGLENEEFHGYAPEDVERKDRLHKLGYRGISIDGDLYHIEHHTEDRRIVVLKIDIEGAERHLFESILTNHNSFDFIAIELDYINLLPFSQIFKRLELILETRKNIRSLEAVGLTLIHSDYFNFFWLNVNLLSKIKK